MNRRADRVMCVYASGNKVEAFRVKAKNARGRPRPPAREERSTSPFPSRAVRCLSVAIFEISSPVARSPRDTLPCRLSVRRICFLADEKPASRPPTSTGSGFVTRRMKAERYNIHFDLQSRRMPEMEPIPTKRKRRGGRSTRNEAPRETVGVAPQSFLESIPFARGMKTRILGRTGLKVPENGVRRWGVG